MWRGALQLQESRCCGCLTKEEGMVLWRCLLHTETAANLPGGLTDKGGLRAEPTETAQGRVSVTFWAGLYHSVRAAAEAAVGRPDLLFCPNAGKHILLSGGSATKKEAH